MPLPLEPTGGGVEPIHPAIVANPIRQRAVNEAPATRSPPARGHRRRAAGTRPNVEPSCGCHPATPVSPVQLRETTFEIVRQGAWVLHMCDSTSTPSTESHSVPIYTGPPASASSAATAAKPATAAVVKIAVRRRWFSPTPAERRLPSQALPLTPPAGFEPATLGVEVRQMQGFWLFLRLFEFSQSALSSPQKCGVRDTDGDTFAGRHGTSFRDEQGRANVRTDTCLRSARVRGSRDHRVLSLSESPNVWAETSGRCGLSRAGGGLTSRASRRPVGLA